MLLRCVDLFIDPDRKFIMFISVDEEFNVFISVEKEMKQIRKLYFSLCTLNPLS